MRFPQPKRSFWEWLQSKLFTEPQTTTRPCCARCDRCANVFRAGGCQPGVCVIRGSELRSFCGKCGKKFEGAS